MLKWVNKIIQFSGLKNTGFILSIFPFRNAFALLLQFVGLLLTFAGNILLARLYGDQIYGVFSLVSGWAMLFSVLGLYGMDDLHLAQVPALHLKKDRRALSAELKKSLKINGITIAGTILLFYLILRYSGIPMFTQNAGFFLYGLLLVPCFVIMYNLLYFLRAMKGIISGEIADKVVRPASFAILALLFYYTAGSATPGKAFLANVFGLLVVIILLIWLVRSAIRKIPHNPVSEVPVFNAALNFRYTLLNLLYLLSIRLDILLVGLFLNASDVGHYTIASRFGDIFGYPVAMLNLSFPALISEKIHHQNLKEASLLPFKISRNAFWLCLATGVVFIFFSPWIFSLFGKQFAEAVPIIPIFLLATLVNASAGLSDVFFIMTGSENKVIISRIFGLITTAILAFFLIPRFSMSGAAWSMLAGNLMYYACLQFFFWKTYRRIINPFFRPSDSK